MNLDDVKLCYYRYRIKECILTIAGEKYEVNPVFISNVQISNDYDKDVFPFFVMTLTLENPTYRLMINPDNADDVTMKLHVQRAKFNVAYHWDLTMGDKPSYKDALNEEFHVVVGQREQDLTEQMQKEIEKNSSQYGQYSSITVSLYRKQYYENYDVVVNAKTEAADPMTILFYCANRAGMNKMLITPADNCKTYKPFTIDPLPFWEQVSRLCNVYALHKNGSYIYFGLHRGYVVKKTPTCTAYEPNEYKNTYITISTEAQGTREMAGGYEDGSKKFHLINAMNITTDQNASVIKKAVGSNILSISAKGDKTSSTNDGGKITRVNVANEGEPTPEAFENVHTEAKRKITVSFRDIDLHAITLNKQFIISADGASFRRYNGKYRVVYSFIQFTKEGDYFSPTGYLLLA